MGKKRSIALFILLAAIFGGLTWVVFQLHEPDPVYQGKTLDYWLTGYNSQNYHLAHPDVPAWEHASEAIRQMGTNAIPRLLRKLQMRESKAKAIVMKLLRKQQFIKISYAPTTEYWNGYFALSALGSKASNAVPQLVTMLEHDPSAFTQMAVPAILGGIGPAAGQAVPALLREAAHTNASVRNNAIYALRKIHPEPKLVVPVLVSCLNDTNIVVRAQAVRALGAYGKDAQAAMPAILKLWSNEPPSPAYTERVPAEGCTVAAAWITVTPASLGLTAPDMGRLAGEALQSIDPEAAAKAGVK